MDMRLRSILFFTFTALFILITPLIIMHSQGYRIDFKYGMIVKTGALFLEPRPAPVKVYVDGKLKKQSNFLFQNIYLGNLFPKSYLVEIKKDGYLPWGKKLAVLPKFVTAAKSIYLFPQNISFESLTANIGDFYPSPNNKYIAVAKKNSIPQLNLYVVEPKQEFLAYHGGATSTDAQVVDVKWNSDSSMIAVLIREKTAPQLIIIDVANYGRKEGQWLIASISDKLPQGLLKISNLNWDLDATDKLFFVAADKKNNFLYEYDAKSQKTTRLFSDDVFLYIISDNKINYVSVITKTLNSFNLETGELLQLTFHPASLEELETSRIFTPDRKKFLIIQKNDIWVHWTQDLHTQPFSDSGDKLRIIQNASLVLDAVWFTKNNEYIIFSDEEGIKIAELDNRDQQNVYEIYEKRALKLHYDSERNTLYFISEGTLYAAGLT